MTTTNDDIDCIAFVQELEKRFVEHDITVRCYHSETCIDEVVDFQQLPLGARLAVEISFTNAFKLVYVVGASKIYVYNKHLLRKRVAHVRSTDVPFIDLQKSLLNDAVASIYSLLGLTTAIAQSKEKQINVSLVHKA